MKGVMRFGKKGKLSPHYVGPYKILRRIGKVAYELDLPNDLASVHPIFDVSLLRKCVGEVFDQQVQKLGNKEVASVMVM
ncbi:hypothetical protein MTR67_023796 [Solanum verrucosum]|uniref:Tf2-1-like SH3-like domain-containing protein n=1 Tax=Solanum verrucosum TaxID=315347 RepID=A0AAF0TS58_SOLVR|nr:hypothetical protein MTR67_023796 [Solanum verrucosum]